MATKALKVASVEDELKARDSERKPEGLPLLRVPFPAHQISKLPKPYKKDSPKGNCAECGGYHGLPAMHLDYVGHAALTDRLLDADINWSWEPVGFTPEGLPALDRNGGLWIKLTVCGVTRYGYGAADGKSGGDAMKEMIGDALRNAAMRFGAALDLWHKGDLHADEDEGSQATGEPKPNGRVEYKSLDGKNPPPYTCPTQLMTAAREFVRTLNSMGDLGEFLAWIATPDVDDFILQLKRDMPDWWQGGSSCPEEFVPLKILVSQKKRDLEQIEEIKTREQA